MAGIEEQAGVRILQLRIELAQQLLHACLVLIHRFDHDEVQAAQHIRDRAAVVDRIGQRRRVQIGAVADHQGDPLGRRGGQGGDDGPDQ